MSWWQTGSGDLIGDIPADRIGASLAAIRPTLPALLDAIAAASGERLAALTSAGRILPAPRPDRALRTRLRTLHAEIAAAYKDAVQRPPTAAEFRACLLFVLAADPQAYLAVPAGFTLDGLDPI